MDSRAARAWLPVGALLYLAALALGLISKAEASSLSLVWPAAGVAVVWLLGCTGAGRPRAALLLPLLVLLAVLANLATGVDLLPSLAFGLVNATHAVVGVAVLRRRGWVGPRPLVDVRDLGSLLLASTAAAAVSAPLTAVVASVAFGVDAGTALLLTLARNAVSTVLVVPLLLGLPLVASGARPSAGPAGRVERALGTVAALGLTAVVVRVEEVPLAFLALSAAVWAGTRTGAVHTARLLGAQGVLVVVAAMGDGSAFGSGDARVPVVLAQTLLVVLVVVGLWLAFADAERTQALQASRLAHDRLKESADAALVGQAVLDVSRGRAVIRSANPALARLLRCSQERLPGSDLLDLADGASAERLRSAVEALRDGARTSWFGDLGLRLGPGPDPAQLLEVEAALGASPDGRVTAQLLDVTARRRAEQRLSHLALHDELTGLANRTLLRDAATRVLAEAERTGDRTGLLSVDLDRFKAVNDDHGHEVGDLLLSAVARRLTSAVRPQDVVARVGGDEFLVLCPRMTDAGLQDVGRRLLAAVGPVVPVGAHRLPITASVGATLPATAAEATALGVPGLVRQADAALLAAKRAGRSRLFVHDAAVAPVAGGQLTDLRRALAAGQLVAHYQPVVDLASGRTVGLEALARWEHPVRGVLPPSAWFDVLEASDLIHPLGQLVLEQSCRDAAALRADGWDLPVHVNVSAQELDRPGLFARVRAALLASGLPASMLVLELTETRLLTIEGSLLHELEAVRAIGVLLAVDDFGTGYSALAHLVQMPVDVLKLDRSFVAALASSQSAHAVASGVIAMARSLEVECVAEGIEDAAQAAELLRLGYAVGQGWHWSRALPLPALRTWLTAQGVPRPRLVVLPDTVA